MKKVNIYCSDDCDYEYIYMEKVSELITKLESKFKETGVFVIFENGDRVDSNQLPKIKTILEKSYYSSRKEVNIVVVRSFNRQTKKFKEHINSEKFSSDDEVRKLFDYYTKINEALTVFQRQKMIVTIMFYFYQERLNGYHRKFQSLEELNQKLRGVSLGNIPLHLLYHNKEALNAQIKELEKKFKGYISEKYLSALSNDFITKISKYRETIDLILKSREDIIRQMNGHQQRYNLLFNVDFNDDFNKLERFMFQFDSTKPESKKDFENIKKLVIRISQGIGNDYLGFKITEADDLILIMIKQEWQNFLKTYVFKFDELLLLAKEIETIANRVNEINSISRDTVIKIENEAKVQQMYKRKLEFIFKSIEQNLVVPETERRERTLKEIVSTSLNTNITELYTLILDSAIKSSGEQSDSNSKALSNEDIRGIFKTEVDDIRKSFQGGLMSKAVYDREIKLYQDDLNNLERELMEEKRKEEELSTIINKNRVELENFLAKINSSVKNDYNITAVQVMKKYNCNSNTDILNKAFELVEEFKKNYNNKSIDSSLIDISNYFGCNYNMSQVIVGKNDSAFEGIPKEIIEKIHFFEKSAKLVDNLITQTKMKTTVNLQSPNEVLRFYVKIFNNFLTLLNEKINRIQSLKRSTTSLGQPPQASNSSGHLQTQGNLKLSGTFEKNNPISK